MEEYRLVWHDEFDYEGMPDPRKWGYDIGAGVWGNEESQYYTNRPENAFVRNGSLFLTARREDWSGSGYTSARLVTFGKASWKYGRFEVRAKLPRGAGSWPAIWMLPDDIRSGVPWPDCGEIDVMEHVGKDENMIHVSLHSRLYNHILHTQCTHFEPLEDVTRQFHTYGLEWTDQHIRFLFDGRPAAEFSKGENGTDASPDGWPFDKPYHLILNIAVGGFWGGEVDESALPFTMEIDSVRVYQPAQTGNG